MRVCLCYVRFHTRPRFGVSENACTCDGGHPATSSTQRKHKRSHGGTNKKKERKRNQRTRVLIVYDQRRVAARAAHVRGAVSSHAHFQQTHTRSRRPSSSHHIIMHTRKHISVRIKMTQFVPIVLSLTRGERHRNASESVYTRQIMVAMRACVFTCFVREVFSSASRAHTSS